MRFFRLLCAGLCLAGLAMPALAADAAADLQAVRDDAYRATTQTFMYVILEKAKERGQDVQRLVADLDKRVPALGDKTLAADWQALRPRLTTPPYLNGEADQRAIYDTEDLTTALARDIEQRMPHDLDAGRRQLYDLAGRLQVMMTIYLRNAADPLGGSNYSGVNRELDPATLAREFSAHLDALAKSKPAVVARVRAKWTFLYPRLTDFNQKSVPYLVDLYGRQIVDQLLAAVNEP